MASIEELTTGTRVRVTSRKGAPGVIDGLPLMDRTVTPPRPAVCIRFDGERTAYGFNYPEQVEVITGPFTLNTGTETVTHADFLGGPLCGWIADDETATTARTAVTCHDCLAATDWSEEEDAPRFGADECLTW